MVSKEFFKQLEVIAIERDIELSLLVDAFSKGLINGYKKEYGNSAARVEVKAERNEINMYSRKLVIDMENRPEEIAVDVLPISLLEAKKIKTHAKIGDVIEQAVSIKDLRRLAVGQIKQVFTQNLRTIEREKANERFKMYQDELITMTVIKVGDKFLTLELETNVTCIIPLNELLPGESYYVGDKIEVYISKIDTDRKGSNIECTRCNPKLIVRLLEKYVPEVAQGVVEIKGIAREAGRLTKICVDSSNYNVDPIGSIVGERGRRINDIMSTLNGEKIELFKYSDDTETLITNALKPVNVIAFINMDFDKKTGTIIVPDDQVSLAIGKKGSNVRLLLQSTGFSGMDIKSESQARELGYLW